MLKAMTIVLTILPSVAMAETCHHYSVWKYPYPQSCDRKFNAMVLPKMRMRTLLSQTPTPMPKPPDTVSPIEPLPGTNVIEILNDELRNSTPEKPIFPEIPVTPLDETIRDRAIEILRSKLPTGEKP